MRPSRLLLIGMFLSVMLGGVLGCTAKPSSQPDRTTGGSGESTVFGAKPPAPGPEPDLLPLAREIKRDACMFVLYRWDLDGLRWGFPERGKVPLVARVAVCNVGYASVEPFDRRFELVGNNGVVYRKGAMGVERELGFLQELLDGAWDWGYVGFFVDEQLKTATLRYSTEGKTDSAPRPVIAYDSEETRKALRQLSIVVPTNVMPPPKE